MNVYKVEKLLMENIQKYENGQLEAKSRSPLKSVACIRSV